jgi:hypothetical protein
MENLPPDRLSINGESKWHDKAALERGIEVYFNGFRQINCVVEYCVSEGWIVRLRKNAHGVQLKDKFHQPIVDYLTGVVKAEWR